MGDTNKGCGFGAIAAVVVATIVFILFRKLFLVVLIVLLERKEKQKKAVELQREVTDTTNELLKKNAEMLKTSTIKTATEVEHGLVDIETLQQVNADLIFTIEESIRIQQEGRQKRVQAETELKAMEQELKEKLVSVRGE